MTKEEARSLVGRAVLYSSGFSEPEKVVITEATEITVEISWPDSERRARVLSGYLMPLPGEGADPLAAIQARLNDFAAAAIRATRGNSGQADTVLSALRELNWAAGLDFEGASPDPPGASREYHAGMAVRHAGSLEIARAWEKAGPRSRRAISGTARRPMPQLQHASWRLTPPALVYLVTHTALCAAKIGVTDAAGSRIAQHRRAGWQLLAAFQVSAEMACVIEDDVLRWWRREPGLPSFLGRNQMPQGGWTETVAAGRIDLAATVTRICNLAVQQDGHPAGARAGVSRLAGGRQARTAARRCTRSPGRWPTGPRRPGAGRRSRCSSGRPW